MIFGFIDESIGNRVKIPDSLLYREPGPDSIAIVLLHEKGKSGMIGSRETCRKSFGNFLVRKGFHGRRR